MPHFFTAGFRPEIRSGDTFISDKWLPFRYTDTIIGPSSHHINRNKSIPNITTNLQANITFVFEAEDFAVVEATTDVALPVTCAGLKPTDAVFSTDRQLEYTDTLTDAAVGLRVAKQLLQIEYAAIAVMQKHRSFVFGQLCEAIEIGLHWRSQFGVGETVCPETTVEFGSLGPAG
jgi:hypothetical protein